MYETYIYIYIYLYFQIYAHSHFCLWPKYIPLSTSYYKYKIQEIENISRDVSSRAWRTHRESTNSGINSLIISHSMADANHDYYTKNQHDCIKTSTQKLWIEPRGKLWIIQVAIYRPGILKSKRPSKKTRNSRMCQLNENHRHNNPKRFTRSLPLESLTHPELRIRPRSREAEERVLSFWSHNSIPWQFHPITIYILGINIYNRGVWRKHSQRNVMYLVYFLTYSSTMVSVQEELPNQLLGHQLTNQLLGRQLSISSRWLIGHQLPISSRCHITHRQHLVTESCLRNLEARRVRPTVTYPCCRLVSISSLTSKGQHAASSKSKAIPLRGCANTCLGANEPSLLPATLASSCIATSAM